MDTLLTECPRNQQARVRHSTMVEPLLRYELNAQLYSFKVVRSYRVTWKMKRCTNRHSCFVSIFKVYCSSSILFFELVLRILALFMQIAKFEACIINLMPIVRMWIL